MRPAQVLNTGIMVSTPIAVAGNTLVVMQARIGTHDSRETRITRISDCIPSDTFVAFMHSEYIVGGVVGQVIRFGPNPAHAK
jgi:hypothetical protein